MNCVCSTIGAPRDIRFCDADGHHKYWLGDKELASVSSIIRQIFPKKSWDGVDPAVVEKARIRGSRVDAYVTEYIRTGQLNIEVGEWKEVRDRVDIVCDWIDAAKAERIYAQRIAYSEKDGVAATKDFDLCVNGSTVIVDLKNTASPEASWKLQLGCQAEYTVEEVSGLFVLHVNPSKYKKGCVLLPYDLDECRGVWRKAIAWYHVQKALSA